MINGVSLEQDEQTYRKQVAYIPEQPMLYEQLTLREHLRLMAQGYAVEEKQAQERMNHYADTASDDQTAGMVSECFFQRDETKGNDPLRSGDRQ